MKTKISFIASLLSPLLLNAQGPKPVGTQQNASFTIFDVRGAISSLQKLRKVEHHAGYREVEGLVPAFSLAEARSQFRKPCIVVKTLV
jgi:hypothetical protein